MSVAIVEGQEVGYSSLIGEGRVHSAIFTDQSIFEAELERIFYTYWVFLAHESEVPEPGDYCRKSIGRYSIVVARGTDGVVRAFFNRCRHRGTMVCRYEHGNAEFFRCPYHGWTYSNRGPLIGVPFPSRYGGDFEKEKLGLVPIARLDQYRGFYFASLADDGPGLTEHLGRAAKYIDMFLQASPTEKVELRAGASKSNFHGNWKFVGMDGYHVNFTHKTVQDLQVRRTGNAESRKSNSDRAPNLTVDLGGGHCRLDLSLTDRVEIGKATSSLIGEIPDTDAGHEYLALMVERWGSEAEAYEKIRGSRDVHLHVWPNLQLIGSEVRVIRPLSSGYTEVFGYPAMLGDVPDEINERRLRGYEWFNGVAGFGTPDDREVFERNQLGLQADKEPWMVLSRGLTQAEVQADGVVVGNITDEVTQRSQLGQWAKAMR
jgi:phenylpropionate dioxygenase-like ring-hydroxylating dioxygenase large terminal subunit